MFLSYFFHVLIQFFSFMSSDSANWPFPLAVHSFDPDQVEAGQDVGANSPNVTLKR